MFATAAARYLIGILIVAAAAGIGWYSIKTKYYNQGWTAALHSIAVQNAKAVKEADDARNDVKACFDSGGTWDVSDDSCLRESAATGKRWWPF